MGKDSKHPKAKPIANAVKLRITDPQDLYVPGDTIFGELLLEVSQGGLTVSKMTLCIRCLETCNLKSTGAIKKTECLSWKHSQDLAVERGSHFGYGCHKFPFSYTIDELKNMPPSASFESLGDKASGVRWYLKAVVGLLNANDSHKTSHNLTDSVEIRFYPITNVTHDDEKNAIFNFESMDVGLKMPEVLQQPPQFWNIQITIMPLEPTTVHSITVTLRKTVVLWDRKDSRVLTEYKRVGKVKIGKVVTEKLTIDGVSQGWRANEFMTPAFTSIGTNLCYSLYVSVLLSKPHILGFSSVDFASPSFERCLKRGAISNDVHESPPPSYSALSGK